MSDRLRIAVLVLLAVAPLPFGSVEPSAWVPLTLVASIAGAFSWSRAARARAFGRVVSEVPGWRLLAGLHLVVVFQLVPLPPRLLAVLSPGSFAFHNEAALVPLTAWRAISVSPPDTARGLVFLAAMSLLYATVYREFAQERWRRRLVATVVGTGFLITLVALAQAASGEPRIYGIVHPRADYAIFGPYVSRSHFAGYMVMAIPLGLALVVEASQGVARAWGAKRGWLALGDPEGVALVRRAAVGMVLVIGLLGAQSRAGLMAFALSSACMAWAFPERRRAMLLIAMVAALGLYWVDLSQTIHGFETRGIRKSRLELWADASRLVPDFPLLGAGFNAFGTAFIRYQRLWPGIWFGEAHNEYLQALLDGGIVGAALVAALLARLLGNAVRSAPGSALNAGLLGSVLGACFSNIVDFNWQIPANAATFVAIAGLTMGSPARQRE